MTDIDALLREKGGIRLDIGCGANKQANFVGMDCRPLPNVDIVWDATNIPWPLPDECVLVAIASHLVEHINPAGGGFLRFMDEVWRVLKPGAQIAIATPYAGSPGYWQDPTHCNGCNEITFTYFDPLANGLYRIYQPKPWAIETMTWNPVGNLEAVLRKRLDDRSYHE